jgi:uncharacterized membrane protein
MIQHCYALQYSWWQKIKQYRVTILVVTIILIIAIALIIMGYRFDWTGFNGNNKSGKTLWDWLQLLIIPLALAVIALVFQLANTRTERQIAKERYEQDQQIAKQRYEQDQQIALDKQREDLLQTYLDCMSELLLDKQLRISEPDSEVRNVARVRTITILFQLDARRIGYVFSFLLEGGLMSNDREENIVSLKDANLRKINFSKAMLNDTNLSGGWLSDADLSDAGLFGSNLSGANLYSANMSDAYLQTANLREADLTQADLSYANMMNADLNGVYLTFANLAGAIGVTVEELEKQAASLTGATMPDGKIHP